jgi:hypothetical protein
LCQFPSGRGRFKGEPGRGCEDDDAVQEFQEALVRLAPLVNVPGRVDGWRAAYVRDPSSVVSGVPVEFGGSSAVANAASGQHRGFNG